jgi:hypothetical protein
VFCDALLLRYTRCPPDLPPQCDGCLQKFSIVHALECKTGGLVISSHNEIRDELSDLASKALSPSSVRNKPKIHNSHILELKGVDESKDDPVKCVFHNNSCKEDCGDILIQGLWTCGTDCITTDIDAKSNRSKDPIKVLATHKGEKKRKCLEACLAQHHHFSPFVVSMHGFLGKGAKTLLKKVSGLLAKKWEKPYSEVCGYGNAGMSIALVRATHLCLHGSRIPMGEMSTRLPQWEDKAGLGLFRY